MENISQIQTIAPDFRLGEFVESYTYRKFLVEKGCYIEKNMPHRLSSSLDFYLGDAYHLFEIENNIRSGFYYVGVRGYRTYSKYKIRIEGEFKSFSIKFKPGGFYRLFGIPMCELTNVDIPLEQLSILPTNELYERLKMQDDAMEMKKIIEQYLFRIHPVKSISILTAFHFNYAYSVSKLAEKSGKSVRQLERIFKEQIGLSPKSFQNLNRFNHLLDLHKRNPSESWTKLCYQSNYFDQSHLIRDFKAYLSVTPKKFNPETFAF